MPIVLLANANIQQIFEKPLFYWEFLRVGNFSKYVLACLNSKACQYYYSSKFKSDTELFPKIRIKQARTLPIPTATSEKQRVIVNLVNDILDIKRSDFVANTQDIENNIDLLVYQLYGLTYDEVLIVDPETPITREDYTQR